MGAIASPDETIIVNHQYKIATIAGIGQLLMARSDTSLYEALRQSREEIASLLPLARGTVLDIGANIGGHTIAFARQAQRVYAFEPQPHTYRVLQANLAINQASNVIALRYALGDEEGEALILPIDANKPHASQGAKLAPYGDPVTVRRLDSFGFADIDFIKIDVEGMDLDVLHGGEHLLRTQSPVVYVEIHSNVEPVIAFMTELGYQGVERIVQYLEQRVLTRGWLFWKPGKIHWI